MKKFTLLLSCLLIAGMSQAQEQQEKDYNRWSIEVNGGLNKPSRPFTNQFYSPTFGPWNADLGVRYMINQNFGLKLSAGYNHFEEEDDSYPFESEFYRGTLEGVVNFGSLLGFREWSNRFNLLLHGGAGVGRLQTGDDALFQDQEDYMTSFIVGVTPQIRLSDHIALTADLSMIGNVDMDYSWDGNTELQGSRGFDGNIVNATVGFTFYLGGAEKHADWVDLSTESKSAQKLDSLQQRVAKLENDLLDSDMDGVPNYLDREPNTVSGVAVDTKGIAVDKNANGIPDEIESSLDERYVSQEDMDQSGGTGTSGTIRKLIHDGYVNVYFQFNSSQPEAYSLDAITYLINYMEENPSVNAELVGYADEIGNAEYNMTLSENRANMVRNILIAAGIDESRVEARGEGIDDSVEKSSADARQLVRRVTFRLK